MIAFLRGTMVEKQPTRVVLDVNGVGYEVFIPLSSFEPLPAPGQECRILTVDYVREDLHQLFGFMTEQERALFILLLGTNGVGPKIALSALSGLSVRDLKRAVVEGDVARLSSVSGIGRKVAERIIVDLRDKLDAGETLEAVGGAAGGGAGDVKLRDAVLALVTLGYKQDQADKMARSGVRRAPDSATVEQIVRAALSGTAKR